MNSQKDPNFVGFFVLLALLIVALIAAAVKFDVRAAELQQYPYPTGTQYPNSGTAYVPTGYVYLITPTPYWGSGTVLPELPPTSTPTPRYQYATATAYPTGSIFPPGTPFGPPLVTTAYPVISPPPTERVELTCDWEEELCSAPVSEIDFASCNLLSEELLWPTPEILIGCVFSPMNASQVTAHAMAHEIVRLKPGLSQCTERGLNGFAGRVSLELAGKNGEEWIMRLDQKIAVYSQISAPLGNAYILNVLKAAKTALEAAMKAAGCSL